MKHKKSIISIAFILLCLGGLHAQEATNTTGGDASGSDGTVSYSVGQVVYTTNTEPTGSVAQGAQQPYEIFITAGIGETSIELEMSDRRDELYHCRNKSINERTLCLTR